jgi:glycerol transport system ATP-binding protein
MNLLPCSVSGGTAWIGDSRIALSPQARAALDGASGSVTLGIRPEFVECVAEPQADTLAATVATVRNLGTHYLADFKVGENMIAAKTRHLSASEGSPVWLRFPPERTLYYINDKRVA